MYMKSVAESHAILNTKKYQTRSRITKRANENVRRFLGQWVQNMTFCWICWSIPLAHVDIVISRWQQRLCIISLSVVCIMAARSLD